jgi:hypothetical protein
MVVAVGADARRSASQDDRSPLRQWISAVGSEALLDESALALAKHSLPS